jgi:hypothetical protein
LPTRYEACTELILKTPRDLAERHRQRSDDGFSRQTFVLPREDARVRARKFLEAYPPEAYMSIVEKRRELPDGRIEFTMRRLPTAD